MEDESDALKIKLLEFVKQTGLNLDATEQAALAAEYYDMIHGWIEQPDHQKSGFLDKAGEQIIKRFATGKRTYSLELVAHMDTPPEDQATVSHHASNFFSRFVRTLLKIFHQEEPQRFGPRAEFSVPTVSLTSVEPLGRKFKITADVTVEDVPPQWMQRAKSRTNRKGELKIETVNVTAKQLAFHGEGFIREETA